MRKWSVAAALAAAMLLVGCAGSRELEHGEAMAREHADERPQATEAVQEPTRDVVEREVVYGEVEGRPVTGYLARPLNARGELPGVVVIHEWWGLNDNIRTMTRRLAGEGYVALAVDMYGGEAAADAGRARELMQRVSQRPEAGVANLRAAARYLRAEEAATRVGLIGWCFGGGWSLRGAVEMPELVDAAVVYYGAPITEADLLRRLDAPLLGHFAAEDQGIPLERVREMERVLAELGKDATILVYPGVGHAFANPSGERYDAEAARSAWTRTLDFFAAHLADSSR